MTLPTDATQREKLAAFEIGICRAASRAQRRTFVLGLFRAVSRAGDGGIWFALAAFLPAVYGWDALPLVGRLAAAAILATLLSFGLKRATHRPRPFLADPEVVAGARPLDRYSFPSGHTLHAVALGGLTTAAEPALGWILVPFAVLVALSRVVLGLHYPSDVVAGALLGAAVALVVAAIL